jgi:hypothetical protein
MSSPARMQRPMLRSTKVDPGSATNSTLNGGLPDVCCMPKALIGLTQRHFLAGMFCVF